MATASRCAAVTAAIELRTFCYIAASLGWWLCGCVTDPPDDDLIFAPIVADAGVSPAQCGAVPCTFSAEVNGSEGLRAELLLGANGFRQGPNSFVVHLSKQQSDTQPGLDAVQAVMLAHEHMSEPTRIANRPSGYLIEDLVFLMPGQWELTLVTSCPPTIQQLTVVIDVR